MSKIDVEKISDAWKARGFSCGVWVDPPRQTWEDFRHSMDELVLVLEGNVEFEIDGKVYHPKIGEELLIPAKALHSVRNLGNTTSRWLYGYKS
jgi:quercetin dioxygenase-like cupin family protein